jgi:hypothetical protein
MRQGDMDDCPLRSGLDCGGHDQWQCAAIAHYDFFYHLENGTLFPMPHSPPFLSSLAALFLGGLYFVSGG